MRKDFFVLHYGRLYKSVKDPQKYNEAHIWVESCLGGQKTSKILYASSQNTNETENESIRIDKNI